MKIQISKERNKYSDNYYALDIQVSKPLTKENYHDIIDSLEKISAIVDPLIDAEFKLKQEKAAKAATTAKNGS